MLQEYIYIIQYFGTVEVNLTNLLLSLDVCLIKIPIAWCLQE